MIEQLNFPSFPDQHYLQHPLKSGSLNLPHFKLYNALEVHNLARNLCHFSFSSLNPLSCGHHCLSHRKGTGFKPFGGVVVAYSREGALSTVGVVLDLWVGYAWAQGAWGLRHFYSVELFPCGTKHSAAFPLRLAGCCGPVSRFREAVVWCQGRRGHLVFLSVARPGLSLLIH